MFKKPDKKPDLKKIDETTWEISPLYRKGMQVPARLIGTKKIIDGIDWGVYEQLTNVACLPGIQKYAFCMPDGHQGYGFPIGGVAAFDIDEGIISPGGIGFDINCLSPSSSIYLEHGTWVRVDELEKVWNKTEVNVFNEKTKRVEKTGLLAFMKREEKEKLYVIRTKSGRELKVTNDHPILTKSGMIEAGKLTGDDSILVNSFRGMKYEKPSSKIIIDIEKIEKMLDKCGKTTKGNAKKQIMNFLKRNNLLELRYNSPQVPILLKLIGFIFGDGVLTFVKNKNGVVQFYGKREDLEEIKKDLKSIGLSVSRVYRRMRKHRIKTKYGISKFVFEEFSIIKKSNAFAILLAALGVPFGRKTKKEYGVPEWIMNAVLWQKRLFLATFFGAELGKPKTINKYNFLGLQLNMSKEVHLKENAMAFLNDVRKLLLECRIKTRKPVIVDGYRYKGKISNTIGLRMIIDGNGKNLIRFFETVGYEYNERKKRLASLAANYLRWKEDVVKQRKETTQMAVRFHERGESQTNILNMLTTEYTGKHYILHAIHDRQEVIPRVSYKFISFQEYIKKYAYGSDGFVWDEVASIWKIPYNGLVYDFTVNHPSHTFIANNIVTHNCGMRLLTTNLTLKEVQPKIKELVNILFKGVPTGVGCKGFVKLNQAQFTEVMSEGVKWCVDNNYGWDDDIKKCESYGKIVQADPEKVSDKAKQRGIAQLGTLGSGNHYLEIQVVKKENIFDKEKAERFGIIKDDQIVIMVHCGSRGFGHQIGTDYLKIFNNAMAKYKLQVNDKELACAPFASQEGQDYLGAMACAANMAFANRQVILHRIREAFASVFKKKPEELEMNLVYDVAHNIAKVEKYKIDGKLKKLVIHRKGSTRAFGPDNPELIPEYQKTGQPVILGGSMETGSYLLVGTKKAEEETFGSTAHGSGRIMSRTAAIKQFRGEELLKNMEKRGIYVKSMSMQGLAEEAGDAYKEIDEVVLSLEKAGISKPVAKLLPIGNIKG